MDYIRSRGGNTGWLCEKHLDKQAANTPTPQQGVLLMIPILHLLREPESYLHTTAAGAWRENRTAQGFFTEKHPLYLFNQNILL